MTNEMKIAAIGECMIEISDRLDGGMTLAYGGDTLNTAVYLARLAGDKDPQVDYLTALGDDPYSDEMLTVWQDEGIGTNLVARLPGRLPGLYTIRTDCKGERSFYYWRGASAAREMMRGEVGARLAEGLCNYNLIYLSGVTLSILTKNDRQALLTALEHAISTGARVAFDPNYRPHGWPSRQAAAAAIDEVYQRCHIALPGLDDECALHGAMDAATAVKRIADLGASEICLKDGDNGCFLCPGGSLQNIPALAAVMPVDTTAAGDSFNAAYLFSRLRGESQVGAAGAGHRLAARVIQYPGAVIPLEAMP